MARITRITSTPRITRIAWLAARTFVLSLAVVQTASNVIHGAGSWIVKPPAGTAIDPGQPLSANLVGAWHFDMGPVPQNLANPAISGTYRGSPRFQPTQDAMSFLAQTDSDYLQVADPAQTLNFTSGAFAIDVDFYYGAAKPGAVLVGRDRQLVDGYVVRIVNDGSGRRVAAELYHSGTSDVIQTGAVLNVGEVNRVLVSFDGSFATIYVNGVVSASSAYTPPSLGSVDLFVGRDPTIGGLNFNNPITRLLMWNRQLTPAEAAQITQSDPYAYMVAPTATQPVLFDVGVGASTPNSVAINWTTNVPADSFVQYGPTTTYGSSLALDPTQTTAHTSLISGLSASQLYHYQVVSKDANGAIVASPDSTFTPLGGMEFFDDFVGSALDSTSWVALGRAGKIGESQYYLPSNAGVAGGVLALVSRVDPSIPTYANTSAMVQWPTFNFLYGTIEIRARFPRGTGVWPALRLLGSNCQQTNVVTGDNAAPCSWPDPGSDEIVVSEASNSTGLVNQQVHSGTFDGGCQTPADMSRNWHTYGLVWTPGSLEWKIDGATTCIMTTGVPSTPMFLVLGVALATGAIDDGTLPQSMAVDYVRVSQQTDTGAPAVTGVSPAGGATGISTSTSVAVTFNEPMAPLSLNAGTIVLSQNGALVPATMSYNQTTRTAILAPLAPLANLSPYTATVKAGPAGVSDVAGNTMPGPDVTWSFTTIPAAPPIITNLSSFSGPAATSVLVAGANFGIVQGTSVVTFNGAPAVPASWSPTGVVAPVPIGATSGPVMVTVGGIASNGMNFDVTVLPPVLQSLSPAVGVVGTPVSISGSNLVPGLFVGKIGSWGPFQSGLAPRNFITDGPDGNFVGNPVFTGEGGGAFTSTGTDFLDIADGGIGGAYDWTSGAWSMQVDFTFPVTPVFQGQNPLLLVTKGSFTDGTGWEIEINNAAFQGKYQIELETNHGVGSSTIATAYQIVPGGFHRALVVCDGNGVATWYVNGVAWSPGQCVAPASAATDLFVGRYSALPGFAAGFPISRLQIWNRALTPQEAITSTTTDPSTGPTAISFNGTPAQSASVSAGRIVTAVPPGATSGPVSVTVSGQPSNGLAFALPDITPPAVINVTPASSAIDVTVQTAVSATFSEALDASTIGPSAMLLTGPGGNVTASITYDGASHTAVLKPAAPLSSLSAYTVTIPAGAGGVTDLAGNPLAADVTWTFTTLSDVTPPAITVVKASPGSTTAVISWTSDKPSTSRVDFGTSAQSLTLQAVDAALVTSHSIALSGLSPKTKYYFRVTSVDAASNAASAPAGGAAPASFTTNAAGLVVAFGFNEGTDASVNDASNSGNNGIVNGATWTNAGRYGKALSFDGVNDAITVAEAPSLDLTTGMTIEAWVKPVTLNGWQTVIYKERPDGAGTSLAWSLYSSDSTAPPALYGMLAGSVGANQWTHVMGASMLPLNTWSHLAGTFDGTALRLYVNGVLIRTLSLSGSLVVTPGPLRIGGHSSIGQFFNGLIDEVRIYNRALSKSEIQGDMTSPLP
jgi:beta-glucanase (GH16 family)